MRSSFSTSLLSPSYVYLEFLIWACTHYFPAPVDFYSAHIHSFNPHSRKGNDGDDSKPEDGIYIFQSTFPRGERLSFSLQNCIYSRDFNPRSREGNDIVALAINTTSLISIHVPARGTTIISLTDDLIFCISIHVPARGTTQNAFSSWYLFLISIHVPARGTTITSHIFADIPNISIHVPARGTTCFCLRIQMFFH